MRFILLFILVFGAVGQGLSRDSIYTIVFKNDSLLRIAHQDSIRLFFDYQDQYGIQDILTTPDSAFVRYTGNELHQGPFSVWLKARFINQGTQSIHGYFGYLNDVDRVWMYRVENGEVVEQRFTGSHIKPKQKYFYSSSNEFPFSVDPGETKFYYFKARMVRPVKQRFRNQLFVFTNDRLVNFNLKNNAWQSFYAGMMLMLSLVSLLMFRMFREQVFIYFAMMMFMFAFYFIALNGLFFTFLNLPGEAYMELNVLSISGLLLSAFLFVSNILHIKDHSKTLHRIYLILTVWIVMISPVIISLQSDNSRFFQIYNITILLWILVTLISIIYLARKGDRSARILFFSALILVISAFIHTYGLLWSMNRAKLTLHVFQIGTLLISGVLFYALFDKINTIRAEKRRFEELDHLKSRFFANISHEFRTPLTLVMGPVKQVMEKQTDPQNRNLLQMAHRNAMRLLQLINQLLDLSKLEAGKMEINAQERNFVALLKGIVMSFESLAVRKNIRLHFVSRKEDIQLFVDQDKMEKIFYNLLSNAFKFTNEQGEVSVLVTDQNDQVEILIRDNGIGIPASRIGHIFDRFFQIDNSETREREGSGIGLSLVKELVQIHGGSIGVESTEGKGTTFTVNFPKGKKHLKDSDISNEKQLSTANEGFKYLPVDDLGFGKESKNEDTDLLAISEEENEKPIVLIIEDNEDVRAYIRQQLTGSFKILEAINGQEGIDKAFEYLPDLIISDVMMPKKDGYAVCEALKTDQRSSHIPVILLTAKAAQEEKLRGLETGADDYLIKPFDTRELEVRVRNLIELRAKLRQRFSETPTIEAEAILTNSVDKAFLDKVLTIIKSHLSDEQFGVEVLAGEVGMSSGNLTRKLKALTDQTTNKFIQSYRLQKAYELLRQKSGNVSEIAFQTGFSSTAYFVKCFGDKYGKTPGTVLSE